MISDNLYNISSDLCFFKQQLSPISNKGDSALKSFIIPLLLCQVFSGHSLIDWDTFYGCREGVF